MECSGWLWLLPAAPLLSLLALKSYVEMQLASSQLTKTISAGYFVMYLGGFLLSLSALITVLTGDLSRIRVDLLGIVLPTNVLSVLGVFLLFAGLTVVLA